MASSKMMPLAARVGLDVQRARAPYWPWPPVWRMYLPSASASRGDGLAVGDLRLADVGLDLELAHHAVDDDLQVQLAHPRDDGLAGLRVGLHAEGRILDRRACASAWPSFSWSAWVFGSMAIEMTGAGKCIDSSTIGVLLVAQRVAGGGHAQADGGRDVAAA